MYNSLTEIAADFKLNTIDINLLRQQLTDQRSQIHPDRNLGEFKSLEDKELYFKLNNAIEFIDRTSASSQLQATAQVTELVKAIKDLIPNTKTESANVQLDLAISSAVGYSRSKFLFPKISLAAVTALLMAIVVFPENFKDHPVLSNFIDFESRIFGLFWITSIITVATFWFVLYSTEDRRKRQLNSLKTEITQRRLLSSFVKHAPETIFSKEDFVFHILEHYSRPSIINRIFFTDNVITVNVAEETASVILQKAVSRKYITPITGSEFQEQYHLSK